MALQRLRGRIGEDAIEQLHAAEASGEDAVAACNALGLFGGEARLVVVDGVQAWKAADVKELEAYVAAPAPTTVLALVGDGIKRDSALAKAVDKAGQVLAYDVSKKQLPEWVAEQFARRCLARASKIGQQRAMLDGHRLCGRRGHRIRL